MFYIASVPGFVLALGMQFAVDSPRWLCKVGSHLILSIGAVTFCFSPLSHGFHMLTLQVGRLNDAKAVIQNLWGQSEVEGAIEDFQSVIKDDGSDLDSRWSELLQEPHSRGCIKVVDRCFDCF